MYLVWAKGSKAGISVLTEGRTRWQISGANDNITFKVRTSESKEDPWHCD